VRALDEHGGTRPRWRARALIPALLAAIGGGSLSCFGDCWPNTTAPGPIPPAPALRPRYVLVRAGNQSLPAVLAETPTLRVRLLADTLVFTVGAADSTRGTYTETLVLGMRDASGVETPTRTVSAPREWTRPRGDGQITLAGFAGGGTATTASATSFEAGGTAGSQLSVFTPDGRLFSFEAR
jgi:hypothetical protein